MKEKLLQKLIVIVLVLCMTATNFIFAVASTVYAIAGTEELEGENVVFEAYFKDAGKKTTQKVANISEGANLYLCLELKAGKLQNAKVKIDNANFKILEEKVNSKFIKNINTENNEIALNEISYNDCKNGVIEIELPIEFQKADKIDTAYFEMENSITLSGKYINSSENGKDIKSNPITTHLRWTEAEEIEIKYSPAIEKIINLENATLVQFSLSSTYTGKYFPKETEIVSIDIPKLTRETTDKNEETKTIEVNPTYTLLVNGDKVDASKIAVQAGTQEISYTNNFINDDKISWNEAGDTYKLICQYEGITKLEEPIEFNARIQKKLYNKDMGEQKTVNVKSGDSKGTIASINAKSTSGEVYKGYMYANSEETTYSEEYNMEISKVDGVTATIELQEDNFKTKNDETISTNGQTEYKEIKINKEKLAKILGNKGKVQIIPENAELSQITLSNATELEEDEAGNIVISYDKIKNSHNVKIQIIDAENEGILKISVTKAIKGNAGYEKETLKTINAIQTTVKSYTDNVEEISTATAVTELKETVTEATLSMNNNNILSTTKNNDIEFIATLKTGTMDTDLLENPTIKIILPEEVIKTEITSVSALYGGKTLQVTGQEVVDDSKIVLIKLAGAQENYTNQFVEGIKVIINAKITLNDMAISRDAQITMKYTNENSTDKEYETSQAVSIQAQYGLITKSSVEADYETEVPTESFETTIINNYGKDVENISIIGALPSTSSKEDFEATIKDSFEATISTNANTKNEPEDIDIVEVKYSTDGEDWNIDDEGAKYYKLELADNILGAGDKLQVNDKFNISQVEVDFKVGYTYQGIEKIDELSPSTIVNGTPLETKSEDEEDTNEPNGVEEETDKISVKMFSYIGNTPIEDEEEVYEAQAIRYIYLITNKTSEDINNVKLEANHENAGIFEDVTIQQINTANAEEMLDFTTETENEDKSNVEVDIGTIKANEVKTVTYQIRVKENIQTLNNTAIISADDVDDIELETENPVKEAELKLAISNNRAKEYPVSKGMVVPNVLKVTNISEKDQENIMVTVNIPNEFKLFGISGKDDDENFRILKQEDNLLILNINKLSAGNAEELILALEMVEEKPEKSRVLVNYTATLNDATYISNQAPIGIKEHLSSKLTAVQTSNIEDEIVKTGDKVIYTVSIQNVGEIDEQVILTDSVPEAAVIKNVYYIQNGKKVTIENIEYNHIVEMITIAAGEKIDVVIETEIDEELTGEEEITNYAIIEGAYSENNITTNKVTYKLQANIKEDEDNGDEDDEDKDKDDEDKEDEDNGDKDNGDEDNGDEDNKDEDNGDKDKEDEDKGDEDKDDEVDGDVTVRSSISGLAWLDENKDGIRQTSEKFLSGIKVTLANIETGKYVKDDNGNKLELTTDSRGAYSFEELENGKYIVIFEYDNTKYRNTEYQASSAKAETNSDIITSKLKEENDNVKYGLTDILELKDASLENIDAGFVENEIFDLNINKYVTKLTVQNSSGTTVKQYNKEKLAKAEIHSKVLAGSTVLVEYAIEVKNEGELEGYANEIVDYIPKDLKFNSEINKNWYISTDGNLHTTALSNTLIKPGETKTVTLTLVKTMTENNTGVTINKAEIAKSSNEYSIPDVDSKAGNEKTDEDDISSAEVIISVNTGIAYTMGIIGAIITITGAGITAIYFKRRKEANDE